MSMLRCWSLSPLWLVPIVGTFITNTWYGSEAILSTTVNYATLEVYYFAAVSRGTFVCVRVCVWWIYTIEIHGL